MSALAVLVAAALCSAAPPVKAEPDGRLTVQVGPLVGVVTTYDAVDGRFSLRAGGLRTREGLSQKIPWFVASGARIGGTLTVAGTALSAPIPRTFKQTFRSSRVGTRTVFPSVIAPPSPGCWALAFTTGAVRARVAVVVRPRPTE